MIPFKEALSFVHEAENWKSKNRDRYAISFYEKALAIYETHPEFNQEKGEVTFEIAHLWRALGKYAVVGGLYLKALSFFEKASNGNPSLSQAGVLFHLGEFLTHLWKLKPAISYYERALSMLKALSADGGTILLVEKQLSKALSKNAPTAK